jgi:uncharacterized membrane protein YkvA (DUF1232 family)
VWWGILLGLGVALVSAWLVLMVFLLVADPRGGAVKESVRLLPDTVRLLKRLATDRATPLGVKIRLSLALIYLGSPIDVIPDFIPVIGYTDDAIVVGAALRSAVRRAGPGAVKRLWPGAEEGLAALWRAARLPAA